LATAGPQLGRKRILCDVDSSDEQEISGLVAAMADAFPEYVLRRLRELGHVAGPPIAGTIDSAASDLAASLTSLLSQPVATQARSPLELVREATHSVTEALIEMGMRPRERDAWDEQEHPEDRFGLYPGSSQELGEEAWRLHLRWGADKARMVATAPPRRLVPDAGVPSAALFGVPSDERDALGEAIAQRGYRVVVWRNPGALAGVEDQRPALVIVDLRHPEANSAIRTLASVGVRTVAVSDQIDDLMMPGVLALGAADVIASDRIAARLDSLLPRLA
jgi:CheY-like chemotaxis protein